MQRILLVVLLLVPGFADTARGEAYCITDYGAVGNGTTLNTAAIQRAIDATSASGGGKLVVPPGEFLTGAIFLKPHVHLHLDDGALLKGSTCVGDYPKCLTRIEGQHQFWLPALLNGKDLHNVQITGSGTLDGNGKPFWTAFWKRRSENPDCTNLEVERPRLVLLEDCTNVLIEGIHLKDSGFWNLHLYRCSDVLISGVTITAPHGAPPNITDIDQPWNEIKVDRAPSSDGIDVDSCQDVVIRGCTISVGDDCIALKGSKGPTAHRDSSSPPVENILIEDCHFLRGHGMLTCGSEATIVRNVLVRRCTVGEGTPVVRLKLRPDTPQLYENMVLQDLTLDDAQSLFDVKPWTQFFDLQGHAPPHSVVRNITIRNVKGTLRSLGELRGNEIDEIRDVVLEDIDVTVERPRFRVGAEVSDLLIKDVKVNGEPFELD